MEDILESEIERIEVTGFLRKGEDNVSYQMHASTQSFWYTVYEYTKTKSWHLTEN